jgi:tetratricopeptide (TPR) repeat protein
VQELLALMRWRQGDLVAAEGLLRPALAVRRRHCGSDNQRTVATLGDLAELLRRRGRLGEAATLFDEAAAGRQEVFDATPPDRGLELTQQADLALARDDLDRAEALYRQALGERRRSFGEASLPVAWSLARLGRCHGEQGSWDEAVEELTAALELLRQLGESGADQVTVLNNLAVVLSYRGDLSAAEALQRQVLAQRRELLGDDHPHTSQARYSLANVLAEQGRGEEAEGLLRRAAAGLAGRLPPGHPAVAYVEVALARQELARGEPAAARQRLDAALGTLRAAHPSGHWRIAAAEAVLGGCLAALGEERRGEALLLAAHRSLVERRGATAPPSRWARRQLQALGVPLAG